MFLITFHLTNKDKKVEIQIEANRPKLSNQKGIRVENYSKPASKKRNPKGQLISKCLFGVIVWTIKPTKFFPGFLP